MYAPDNLVSVSYHIYQLQGSNVSVEFNNRKADKYILLKIGGVSIYINRYEDAALLFRQLLPHAMLALAMFLAAIKHCPEEIANVETVSNS